MSFEYAPLSSSRQIRLLKASFDHAQTDVIQCDFLVADLDDLPCDFVAISYLWGPPEKPEKAWCNGLSIDITLSAMAVLRMAASNPDIEYIWIDALCIDQSNLSEKSVQICLMRYVYPAAKRTIAWLGNVTATSNDAMDFIITLHAALKEIESQNVDPNTLSPLVDIEGCHCPSPRWEALSILLDNKWFRRLWVLQEMALASQTDLVCDQRSIPWSSLAFVATELNRHNLLELLSLRELNGESYHSRGLRFLRLVDVIHHQSPGTVNLAHLLVNSSYLEVSDDRDRIYALLGLANNAVGPIFEPDYANTPSKLFVSTAAELLSRGNPSNLILHCAGIGYDRKLLDLPSWVPDWTEEDGALTLGFHAFEALYRAGGNTTKIGYQHEGQILTLSVYIFDVITNFVAPCSDLESRLGFVDDVAKATAILAWKDNIQDLYLPSIFHPCGLAYYPDIVWRTLVASTTHTGVPAPVSFQQSFQDLILDTESVVAMNDTAPQDFPILESAHMFHLAMSRYQYHRSVFASQQGYLGLGPPKIELGDKICVFPGFRTPFTIRPRAEGGYFLVGECYVYGLMDGEALVDGTLEEITLH